MESVNCPVGPSSSYSKCEPLRDFSIILRVRYAESKASALSWSISSCIFFFKSAFLFD